MSEEMKSGALEIAAQHGIQMPEKPIIAGYAPAFKDTPMPKGWGTNRRNKWETTPLFVDAVEDFSKVIEAEDRTVTAHRVSNLVVRHNGLLIDAHEDGDTEFDISPNAWRQLKKFSPKRLQQKREQFNYWRRQLETTGYKGPQECRMLSRKKENQDYHLNQFTKEGGEERDLFGIVSKESNRSYQVHWSDEILRQLAKSCPKDARAVIRYNRDAVLTTADITLNAPHEIELSAKVNQLFRAGIRTKNRDNGNGGYSHSLMVWSDACSNGMAIPSFANKLWTSHKGKSFLVRVQEMIEYSSNFMEQFSNLWKDANIRSIKDSNDDTTLGNRDCLERLVALEYISVDGIEPGHLVNLFMEALQYNPGKEWAKILDAITLTAHAYDGWRSPFCQEDLEEQAGELLYQQVQVLDPLTKDQNEYFQQYR